MRSQKVLDHPYPTPGQVSGRTGAVASGEPDPKGGKQGRYS